MAGQRIEVWLGYGASEEQGREVEEAFKGAGIEVEVRFEEAHPAIGNGAGFTLFIGVIGFGLGAFVKGYLEAAGADAWAKTKELLRTLKADHLRRYPSEPPTAEGQLVFKDPKRRVQVALRTDLPEEAWAKLAEVDLEAGEQVSWWWDAEAREWVETDLSDFEDWSPLGPDHPDA
jgi:hypothetical protein